MQEFDYVVIGAGSSGCVIANRLSADPSTSVLLIEAGSKDRHPLIRIPAGFPQLFQSRLDWNFATVPQLGVNSREVYWPRGKVLGGSSSINAMMWVRGMKADYDRWADVAGAQWSYDAVLPYFRRIESTEGEPKDSTQRGVNGTIPISRQRDPNALTKSWLAAAKACGLSANDHPNGDKDDGVGLAMVNQRSGRRVSAADAYLRPIRNRKNLTVRTDANCSMIVIENYVATGVHYRHHGKDVDALARREVISCAGAIGSPMLLMSSGIGPDAMLAGQGITVVANRQRVGKGLQDHLTAGVVFSTKGRTRSLAKAQSLGPVLRYLTTRRGLLSSNIAEAYGFIRSSETLSAPDLELLFVPGPFLDQGLTLSRTNGLTVGAVLLQPRSRGEITLSTKTGKLVPSIDPKYLSDPEGLDAATLSFGVRKSLEILQHAPIASVVGQPIQPSGNDVDALIESAVHGFAQTLYHPVGTCAMGTDDDAVVDPNLCVRGVKALRVADASVIPEIIRGHTHAPSVLIGEMAADLILNATRP